MRLDQLPGWAGKAIFGVAAAGLLALGGWVMTGPSTAASSPKPTPAATVDPGYVQPPDGAPTPGSAGRARTPAAGAASKAPTVNPVGNLALPLSDADLLSSAALAVKVTAGMNTYRWDENPTTWAQKLGVLVSGDATTAVADGVPTGAVLNAYITQRISTSAVARIFKVRLIAEGQAAFDVAVAQTSTGSKGKRTTKANYWVSVDTSKSRVTSIQAAGTGN